MEKNRCKNDYREHVRCGMQRRVNILMTDVPKKGNISSETEKKFKDSRDKIFLKQSLNLYLIGHILSQEILIHMLVKTSDFKEKFKDKDRIKQALRKKRNEENIQNQSPDFYKLNASREWNKILNNSGY